LLGKELASSPQEYIRLPEKESSPAILVLGIKSNGLQYQSCQTWPKALSAGVLLSLINFSRSQGTSCAEVRSQLYVALDTNYLQPNEFDSLMTGAEEVSRIVGGLPAAVKRKLEAG
jgi:hypothetical protein